MRLDDQRESSNIQDDRGNGGGGFGGGGFGLGGLPIGRGGIGLGGIAVIVVVSLLAGVNPLTLLGGGSGYVNEDPAAQQQAGPAQLGTDTDHFVAKVLGSTEDTWGRIFQQQGKAYRPTTLVLYDQGTQSGCGAAQSAMGPFYCPTDSKVYLDESFFNELTSRFGAAGDFAEAYVIAHEVGHHVQHLTGIADQVQQAQARASRTQGNAIQVRMELQADCYAGVWGAANKSLLDPGDLEEALTAAQAIGDDTLQKQATGRVVPDGFTHGTSAQRMRWLKRGYDSGDPAQCDTFSAAEL